MFREVGLISASEVTEAALVGLLTFQEGKQKADVIPDKQTEDTVR